MVFIDCPICLYELYPVDNEHPIQCETRCGYNFCKHCIESFITSSKDDYLMASDGSKQVKVFLNCPMCRSSLSHSIRNTLLLRKADEVIIARKNHEDESKFTDSQRKLKHALHTTQVKNALAEARALEAKYLRDGKPNYSNEEKEENNGEDNGHRDKDTHKQTEEETELEEDDNKCFFAKHEKKKEVSKKNYGLYECDDGNQYDEIGIEIDLLNGVHNSVRFTKIKKSTSTGSFNFGDDECSQSAWGMSFVEEDPTLFAGLDCCLTKENKSYVTEYMTSGHTEELAEVAHYLCVVAERMHEKNKRRRNDNEKNINNKPLPAATPKSKRRLQKMSSIFELIEESNTYNRHSPLSNGGQSHHHGVVMPSVRSRASIYKQRKEQDLQMKLIRDYPLPVRMPKCIMILINPNLEFNLVDYEWNGTVMDAYRKISIRFGNRVDQKRTNPNHKGIRAILGDGNGDVRIEMPGQIRVLLGYVGREAGMQGALKGDVVTHIDGESVAGKNASELTYLIESKKKSYGKKLALCLNAERSVAEALKRRAEAISTFLKMY